MARTTRTGERRCLSTAFCPIHGVSLCTATFGNGPRIVIAAISGAVGRFGLDVREREARFGAVPAFRGLPAFRFIYDSADGGDAPDSVARTLNP
jgi:hypothetical protein